MPRLPLHKKKFLTVSEKKVLTDFFKNTHSDKKWFKKTSPVTLDLAHFKKEEFFLNLLDKLKPVFPSLELIAGNFFYTPKPYIVHVDHHVTSPPKNSLSIVLPLKLTVSENISASKKCSLLLFRQRYNNGGAKFFFGDSDLPRTSYPHRYTQDNIQNIECSEQTQKNKKLNHLRPQWCQGLSVEKDIPWVPGDLIAFSGNQLHCSSNFLSSGITSKTGLALFGQTN